VGEREHVRAFSAGEREGAKQETRVGKRAGLEHWRAARARNCLRVREPG
jgi:hypothetical protein